MHRPRTSVDSMHREPIITDNKRVEAVKTSSRFKPRRDIMKQEQFLTENSMVR